MKLSECKMGEIVIERPRNSDMAQNINLRRIGHIVGLGRNMAGHIIPIVRWAEKNYVDSCNKVKPEEPFNHNNLDIYKEQY